jgi:hypothetical protein
MTGKMNIEINLECEEDDDGELQSDVVNCEKCCDNLLIKLLKYLGLLA